MFGGAGWKSRVLIVSQDPRELAELKKELMRFFEINIAANAEAAKTALEAYGADALVVLAGEDISAFAALSGEARAKSVPAVFLARSDDEGLEAAALAMGGDYAVKRRSAGALVKRLQARISERAAPPEEALRGKTLLIAEDVELNRDILAAILSGVEGLTLDFAADGEEALEKYRSNARLYSMVFLDIHMPKMDGIAAAKAIRGLSGEAAKVPVFALTASGAESESVRLCEEAGMNGYLQKPVDYDEFIRVCAKYIT